jgi:hypothetical protein
LASAHIVFVVNCIVPAEKVCFFSIGCSRCRSPFRPQDELLDFLEFDTVYSTAKVETMEATEMGSRERKVARVTTTTGDASWCSSPKVQGWRSQLVMQY